MIDVESEHAEDRMNDEIFMNQACFGECNSLVDASFVAMSKRY